MISFESELVRASAGSGKTHKLTNRYIRLLAAQQQPDEILATTFTRKAAFEIRERVLERLLECSHSKRPIEFEDGVLLAPSRALELLRTMLDEQHRVAISTLDSFFIQLFSCFAFELGFNDQWSILSTTETDELFRMVAFDVSSSEDPATLRTLLSEVSGGTLARSVVRPLVQTLYQLHELFLENSEDTAWCWINSSKATAISKEQLLKYIEELLIPQNKDGSLKKRWSQEKQLLTQAVTSDKYLDLVTKGVVDKVLNGETSYDRVEIDESWIQVATECIEQAANNERVQLSRRMKALFKVVAHLDRALAMQLLSRGVMRFSDVKSVLTKVWERGLIPDDLMYRLDSNYKHLLFDEFQDTSRGEFVLLQPFVVEKLASQQAGEQHSFYCVGDVKQAIYGWRGGAVDIFDSLDEWFSQYDIKSSSIVETRRCAPAVLRLVNEVFATLLTQVKDHDLVGSQVARHWESVYQEHTTNSDWHKSTGYSSLVCLDVVEPDADKQEMLVGAAVTAVSSVLAVDHVGDIGVICRSNSMVAAVLSALRHAGIAVAEEGGGRLLDSPLVALLHQALTLLEHPSDEVAAFMVYKSPITNFFFSEDFQNAVNGTLLPCPFRLSRQRELLFERGLYGLLLLWSDPLRSIGGERDQRRLQQLLQFAQRLSTRGETIRVQSFLNQLELEKIEDTALTTRVRVMTVHQSKGLGFDHVVLPELSKKLLQPDPHAFWVKRSVHTGRAERIVKGVSGTISSLLPEVSELRDEYTAFQTNEELCVLYVALTRAKKSIQCIIAEKSMQPKSGAPSTGQLVWAAMNQIAETREAMVSGQRLCSGELSPHLPERSTKSNPTLPPPCVVSGARYTGNVKSKKAVSPSASTDSVSTEPHSLSSDVSAKRFGVAVHRALAHIVWVEKGTHPATDSTSSIDQYIADAFNAGTVASLFFKNTFQIPGSRAFAFPEFRYSYLCDDVLHTGSIDRLVLREVEGVVVFAWVIDFKVGSSENNGERYDSQLKAYQHAIAHLFSLPVEAIRCMVVYMRDGIVRNLGV